MRFGIFCCLRSRVAISLLVLTASMALDSSVSQAANPSLGSIGPIGAQRGTEVEVTFNGARFADAQEILIYYPGITVTHFEVASDTQVKTKLAIAPDCRLGIHAMRVRTATGITNLRTFMVGALEEVAEVEPNSEFAQPQAIPMERTVTGVVQNEDVDFFQIDAKKGERITAEVEGIRLGNTFFDAYVAIMDANRFELSSSDDSALVWQDGVASILAPEDGKYIVQVRESSYGGSGACTYRLHVGRFPRPMAVLPAGGRAAEALEVKWLGDVAGERTEQIVLPSEVTANFGLFAADEFGVAPSPNWFRLGDLANVIETEPNNSPPEATPFEAPMALNGVISEAGDVDIYKFAAKKGQVYDVRVHARKIRSPLDPVLNILRANGSGVAGNDDSGGPDSYLRFTAPEDGEFLVQIRDHLLQGGAAYVYRAELTPVTPRLTMGLPERDRYNDTTVSVPKNNRTVILVSGGRADFGGDLNVSFDTLPAGVAIETVTMRGNRTTVPVLFSAGGDAALAGALIDIVGRPVDENLKVVGHLSQSTSLVRGRNNIRVWDHKTERMALAVTEEVPYKIDIVQPQVPLVRNGNMALKIVATRQEGFTAPIALRMLYNPPGVGSAGNISIPEGQNEAIIALNANGGAEIRTWKIAVTGQATVGNGAVLTSTQLADLEVADSFFKFEFLSAAVEQAQATEVVIKVTKNRDFPGPATVELLGLPNEITTTNQELNADTVELIFPVTTTANSPAGTHKTLLCRAIVTINNEPITHMLGTGQLRVDKPLPPKANEPAKPAAAAKPVVKKPMEKRLTRLEKLRLERQEAKAAQVAAEAAKKEAASAEAKAAQVAAEAAKKEAASAETKPAEAKPAETKPAETETPPEKVEGE